MFRAVLRWSLPGLQAGQTPQRRPILPECRGLSREQSREHRGFRSRPVADAPGAPVLRDQGPIGRPGTARPIQALPPYMPYTDQRRWTTVSDRGCPLGTDNDRCEWHGSGTARGQPWYACRCWVHLDHRVRAVRGNYGYMGKPLQTARQLFRMPSGHGRMGRWLRRPASMPAELGSSRPRSKVGSTCRFSRRPRLGTLSRHLYCGNFDARRGKESPNLHSMDTAGRCHIQLLPIRT